MLTWSLSNCFIEFYLLQADRTHNFLGSKFLSYKVGHKILKMFELVESIYRHSRHNTLSQISPSLPNNENKDSNDNHNEYNDHDSYEDVVVDKKARTLLLCDIDIYKCRSRASCNA